jgi:hypothetical protein
MFNFVIYFTAQDRIKGIPDHQYGCAQAAETQCPCGSCDSCVCARHTYSGAGQQEAMLSEGSRDQDHMRPSRPGHRRRRCDRPVRHVRAPAGHHREDSKSEVLRKVIIPLLILALFTPVLPFTGLNLLFVHFYPKKVLDYSYVFPKIVKV